MTLRLDIQTFEPGPENLLIEMTAWVRLFQELVRVRPVTQAVNFFVGR